MSFDNLPARMEHLPDHRVDTTDMTGLLLTGLALKTVRSYLSDWSDFARWLTVWLAAMKDVPPGPPLVALEVPHALGILISLPTAAEANRMALQYRAHLEARGLAPATVARRLASLRAAVKRARLVGLCTWELEVPSPKVEPYRDVRGPGDVGIARMLEAIDHARIWPPQIARDEAMLWLLYGLGLRRSELVGLDLVDLDEDAGRLAVKGKGRTEKDWLTVPAPVLAAVGRWIAVRQAMGTPPEEPALFLDLCRRKPGKRLSDTGVYLLIRRLGVRGSLSRPVKPHGVRHAAITSCARRSNGNAVLTQRFGRHKSLAVTTRYIDEVDDAFGTGASLVAGALAEATAPAHNEGPGPAV